MKATRMNFFSPSIFGYCGCVGVLVLSFRFIEVVVPHNEKIENHKFLCVSSYYQHQQCVRALCVFVLQTHIRNHV